MFPWGANMTALDHVLHFMFDSEQIQCCMHLVCDACPSSINIGVPYSFPNILDTTSHDAYHQIHHTSPQIQPVLDKTFNIHSMDLTEWILAGTMLALDQQSHFSFTPTCSNLVLFIQQPLH